MKWYLFTIILIVLLLGDGGICIAGTNSDPGDYPPHVLPYDPKDEPDSPDGPADYPPVEPTMPPTIEPTYTIEPTSIGGESGWFKIDSDPQGAEVSFDGSPQGITPALIKVSTTGTPSHTLRVSKTGYQDWTDQISGNPGPGETLSRMANLVEIQPTVTVEPTGIGGESGWFKIDSDPQGAEVSFDGSPQGITPALIKVSTTGTPSHTLRVLKIGYQDWTDQISGNPGSGEIISRMANLVEIQPTVTVEPTGIGGESGWFKIDSDPQGADVRVDDSYYGTSPVLVKVMSTGTPSHTIRVTMNGFREYVQQVSMNPGKDETIPIFAPLVPLAQYGSIYVSSDPTGAIASLDSGVQYLTPCTFSQVVSGIHTVMVSKAGYNPYTAQIQV
ncbi:MAG: PEGA domain-containing protein, partial [Methanospirillum sp.]|uniref:PEGA domain-containing protein n=1 Tax=Methanospirillum sp. TaxID=45200 RepID=UPI00236DF4DC